MQAQPVVVVLPLAFNSLELLPYSISVSQVNFLLKMTVCIKQNSLTY
ncbi:hypothetical protein MHA_1855 [Mannheimia haemolytica PHL213]|nr:hypothetical protein MHA_1855 [Mannheimia haemolytica PHL213]